MRANEGWMSLVRASPVTRSSQAGKARDGTVTMVECGQEFMPAYSVSAAIYDAVVGRYAFEHWRDNFERLEKRYGLDISCVADVACGSGLQASYLAGRGASVFACDLSQHMLKEAAENCSGRRVRFIRQDMRYLQLPAPVSLLNCATDALNHLLSEGDVVRTLSSFRAALRPGGYALFDMNTAWQLREGSDDSPWEFEVEGCRMRWLSAWDESSMTSTVVMVFVDAGGPGHDVVEIHRERAYDSVWVLSALKDAGFSRKCVMDAAGLGKPCMHTRRMQFVAQK